MGNSCGNCCQIIDIKPNSPASNCGLTPFVDFLITSPEEFPDLVERNIHLAITIPIYNIFSKCTREITLIP